MICMALITAGFGFSLYQSYWPIHIIDIHSPLKILTPRVKAGEVMIYQADYCLFNSYPATVARTLVNHSYIQLPIVNTVGVLGCHKANVQIPIPDGAEIGTYHMEGIVTYKISPTRSIDIPFSSEDFKVVK